MHMAYLSHDNHFGFNKWLFLLFTIDTTFIYSFQFFLSSFLEYPVHSYIPYFVRPLTQRALLCFLLPSQTIFSSLVNSLAPNKCEKEVGR